MNKSDRARLDAIHRLPCICCGRMPVEAHHIVSQSYRRLSGGHQSTIPLCAWHHRGVVDQFANSAYMALTYGPSLALTKRAFIARYGTERELLAKVNDLLGAIK